MLEPWIGADWTTDTIMSAQNCDPKKFAQSKGVERRKFWDMPIDSDIDIAKI
jgi:hypothetical protein